MIRKVLLGFAGIALLVGAFVIFNTLSITVAQRTREFATLRTLGASRKQVMRSVVLEGIVIGLVASVIGLVLGLGIAKGMVALFSALGVDLPDATTVFASRTIIVSLMLGTGITLVASILPAKRATRMPPIAAVREGATLPPRGWPRIRTTPASASCSARSRRSRSALRRRSERRCDRAAARRRRARAVRGHRPAGAEARQAAGAYRRLAGPPRRRVAGDLAGANTVRNPGRTASTAAALMIGLTLVTVVAVLGAGFSARTRAAVSDQVRADHVIDGEGSGIRAPRATRWRACRA